MAQDKIICPSCGFKNQSPVPNNRCASCGAKVDDVNRLTSRQSELEHRYEQEGFSVTWFAISIVIMGVLTAALVLGLPMVVRAFDFEGYAGMMIAIPVWFAGGLLIGLISPGKTFIEPVIAAFLIAVPTALFLHEHQTVKTLPGFMYMLLSALGILFALIGAYLGERIQVGPPAKAAD